MAIVLVLFMSLVSANAIFALGNGPSLGTKKGAPQLKALYSNGCSLPDTLSQKVYEDCCFEHDVSYWQGGSLEDKRKADTDLANCIRAQGAFDLTAGGWQVVLQNFAMPNWGSGWEPRRPNKPLTANEKKLISDKLREGFRQVAIIDTDSVRMKCPTNVLQVFQHMTSVKAEKHLLNCYGLKTKDSRAENAFMVFSSDCENGFFTYFEEASDARSQDKKVHIGAYGMCSDQLKNGEKGQAPPATVPLVIKRTEVK